MAINLKKNLVKKWYKSKWFIIGSSVASVGVITPAVVVPAILSFNQNDIIANHPSVAGPDQEIKNKLDELNKLDLSKKQKIIQTYLNHKDKDGKTPIDVLIKKLQENTSNNTNLANFLFNLFPNLQNILTNTTLLNKFLEGKNLNILSDSTSKKTYLENSLLSFPSKSVTNTAFIQTLGNSNDNFYIICNGINWDLSKDIKFVLQEKSFFVNMYNNTNTNIMNINITKTNPKISYNSASDNKFVHINLFNYGFESFNKWFEDNILANINL